MSVCVYYVDIGQREYVPISNIRVLSEEFRHRPALAIPCHLHGVYPVGGDDQSIWKSDDPVHDEFNRLMVNNVTCKVYAKPDQTLYDVEIEIPSM